MPSLVSPPAPRMHYELDGTIVLAHSVTSSLSAQLTVAQVQAVHDEDTADFYSFGSLYSPANGANTKYLTFVFPEARNLVGIWAFITNRTTSQTLQISTDTTTGLDGTWTNALGPSDWTNQVLLNAAYRASITTLTANNIKGCRILTFDSGSFTQVYVVHLYGTKLTNAGLSYLHPTIDQALAAADMDFGDVAQGLTYTKTFRVKNNHATQQANGIVISAVDVSTTAAYQFSIGGGGYSSSLDIGALAAGAISGVVTCRRIVPGGETPFRAQHSRLSAIPTSWT